MTDRALEQARRDLASDPENYCLNRLVSQLETRLGIRGKPVVLVVSGSYGKVNCVCWASWSNAGDVKVSPIDFICDIDWDSYPLRNRRFGSDSNHRLLSDYYEKNVKPRMEAKDDR